MPGRWTLSGRRWECHFSALCFIFQPEAVDLRAAVVVGRVKYAEDFVVRESDEVGVTTVPIGRLVQPPGEPPLPAGVFADAVANPRSLRIPITVGAQQCRIVQPKKPECRTMNTGELRL